MKTYLNFAFALLCSLVLFTSSAFALSLDEAKAKGDIGEKHNGYVAAVSSSPSAEIKALVESVNTERRKIYEGIAKGNGSPLSAVETLAAKKAFEKAPSGVFLESSSGGWAKK